MAKWFCDECEWAGPESEVLTAENPFAEEPGVTMRGCPLCREPNTMTLACDHEGCKERATSGTNTPQGYRQTCYDHHPDRAFRNANRMLV